ncbi:hypothetical protein B0J14DRAFT_251123 [Halenospora varia]|nr:hypothetical protein B0J14DRAFT_251123 [Halenospora varia]
MVDDTTINSTPAQSEAVDYSLLYAKEIPSTLVVEERDGEPIKRRGELSYKASIGMWDHRLGEPLDFDGNLDTEAQHLDVTLDIKRHLGMWDHHLGEAPYLEGHVSGALDLQEDLGMWDHRLGEPLDLEGSLNLGDKHVGDVNLGMWDHRLGEPLDLEGSLNLGDKHVGDVNLDMWDHRLGEPLRLHLEANEESMT